MDGWMDGWMDVLLLHLFPCLLHSPPKNEINNTVYEPVLEIVSCLASNFFLNKYILIIPSFIWFLLVHPTTSSSNQHTS
jgi:hypothetical protein